MPFTNTSPADLACRLAERRQKRTRTLLVFDAGICRKTQIGYAWSDAFKDLWEGPCTHPVHVFDFDPRSPAIEDATLEMAKDLSRRTFAEGLTPAHLLPLFARLGLPSFGERESRSRGLVQMAIARVAS